MSDFGVFTIGYGSRSIDDFVAILKKYQIEYLIDVRSKPYSKYKPEFSKDPLASRLSESGIRYVFMGDQLGGQPADGSCYTEGKADYFKIEEKSFYWNGIQRIVTAFEKNCRVVLMCSEGKPQDCHRSKLISETLTKKRNVNVLHIDEAGAVKTHHAVLSILIEGQLSFFDNAFTSRKTYNVPTTNSYEH